MNGFPLHTAETAPEGAKQRLAKIESALGFIPNVLAAQAEAPALLEGYQSLSTIFDRTSLSPVERQVVLMTASFENDCRFCMAAHSWVARRQGIEAPVIDALRAGTAIADARLDALHRYTRAVVVGRGKVPDSDVAALLAAGFTRQNALEVVLGVALKVLTNYTNSIAGVTPNEAFRDTFWTKP